MFHRTHVVLIIFLLAGRIDVGVFALEPLAQIMLNGHTYDLELLSRANQGSTSTTYDILGGFQLDANSRAPAILKVISHYGNDKEKAKIEKEILYLRTVGLVLFTKVNNLKSFIVMWNVRQGNPPLKPYPEWYLEDRTRNLAEDLQVLRENIENKLLSYTKPGWELRYEDFHFLNIYVDKTLKTVKPIDWGPAYGKYWGVRKIRGRDDLVEYEKFLSKNIPIMFNRAELADILKRSNNKLWPWDRHRRPH